MAIRKTKSKPRAARPKKARELTLVQRLAAIGDRLSPEDRAKIPTDVARNVDHYLYGAPKQHPD